jgi:hypothetical protein
MLRKYYHLTALMMLTLPAGILAQGAGQTGMGTGNAGMGMGNNNGIIGQANTTLLGNSVNLNFQSVFGTSATIANTNPDPFAAYRPTGSGTGSAAGAGTGFAGTGGGLTGGGLAGGGMGTAGRTGTGLGTTAGLGGNTGLRAGTGLGAGGLGGGLNAGTLGGGLGGALGGNRMGMGGMQNMMGGNRMGMGMMGGGGFLGNNSAFLGGNNQMNQTQQATIGYQVNYDGKPAPATGNAVAMAGDFTQRLSSSPGMQGAQNLQVMMRGDTAILRGQVTSEYSKQLAAAMVRLEPGVYEVQNELQIVAPVK